MRSEHKPSYDENSFLGSWRAVTAKPAIRRLSAKVKRLSHKKDRQILLSRTKNWEEEY